MDTKGIAKATKTLTEEKQKLLSSARYDNLIRQKKLMPNEIKELTQHRTSLNKIRCAEHFMRKNRWGKTKKQICQ
jgi:hypothetical protein